jgi:DNA mismatch endonuclease, patch repair protein
MTDTRTPAQRRRIMQSVSTKNTGPEWEIRRLLFSMRYRYRLHDSRLPGTPDIVFSGRKRVIFVHGCFWHGHGCSKGQPPKSRPEFWGPKLFRNRERDAIQAQQIEALGWSVLTLWQCELKDREALKAKIVLFLEAPINKPNQISYAYQGDT